ncbi:pentatricopeptide repeat-containing protein At4g02750 [Selaginella moellendorffii]|uniref:pentatricopeptide repeat-containing protein At4g02750 n=1 Tax=Selaginella moellendorffii TaxID=88036 RepID=UPI000D1C948E|nr:pentatricopeptide repeat-containing protein At4g02750 [Selaginella moellendorffii]|eukprot:XP_024519077.1 pentatricopeptide repeat-containing protein At4g02750 [Selaginella moellendorffii]
MISLARRRKEEWSNNISIQSMIQQCAAAGDLAAAKSLHARVTELGLDRGTVVGNLLVRMYGMCGSVTDAQDCLARIWHPNVFSQNIIVAVYSQNGHLHDARCAFDAMQDKNVVSWTTMLSAYSQNSQLDSASQFFANMPLRNVVSWNAMITAYAQSGHLDKGLRIFDSMPGRDLASWTALISAPSAGATLVERIYSLLPARELVSGTAAIAVYSRAGNLDAARSVFDSMPEHNAVSCNAMIAALSSVGALDSIQEIFARMPHRTAVSWNSAIQAHAAIGHLECAKSLFDLMPQRDSVSWTLIVSALGEQGFVGDARMAADGAPERWISLWNALVGALARNGYMDEAQVVFFSMDSKNATTWTAMIGGLASSGDIDGAERAFAEMPERDLVSWTAMLWGYAQNGHAASSARVFWRMPCWDAVAWNALIVASSEPGDELEEDPKSLFDRMPGRNSGSWSATITALVHSGQLDESREVFDRLPSSDAAAWSTLIQAYVNSGRIFDARELLERMPCPDGASWTTMVKACVESWPVRQMITDLCWRFDLEGTRVDEISLAAIVEACGCQKTLAEGKLIHQELDAACFSSFSRLLIAASLVDMYGKCRSPHDAWLIFAAISQSHSRLSSFQDNSSNSEEVDEVVLWTSMISAFAQNNLSSSALQLFHRMLLEGIQPDVIAYTTVLDACGVVQARAEGKVIHSSITDAGLDTRAAIASSLITMYSKWGCIDEIEHVFDKVVLPNVVVWTALISAYAHNGHGRLALHSFARMDAEGVQPDHVTFISVVDACASIPEVTQVRLLHDEISCWNLDHHPQLQNALLSLYSKCGCVDRARIIFERLPTVGVIPGSAMLQAYAENGHGHQTLSFFRLMVLQGVHPENVTFLSILSACSHAGLVEVGCDYFASMKQDYEVEETVEHFTCMVDLFARSGKLEEAEELIGSMPFQPEDLAWLALLAGCRSYGHVERGIRAASRALELNPTKTSAPYVLLSGLNGDCK